MNDVDKDLNKWETYNIYDMEDNEFSIDSFRLLINTLNSKSVTIIGRLLSEKKPFLPSQGI